jgi:hypothetical protein
MSIVMEVIIGGWMTTFAMFGFLALAESGKLLKIRNRMALWLESAATAVRNEPELEREDAA